MSGVWKVSRLIFWEKFLKISKILCNLFNVFMTEIQLSVSPGKLLTYRPYLPYKIDGNHLKYGSKKLITFFLTDEQNRPIDTFGENYSFAVVIKYKVETHTTNLQGYTPTFRHY